MHSSITLTCIWRASSTALVLVDWTSADFVERKSIFAVLERGERLPLNNRVTVSLLLKIKLRSRSPKPREGVGGANQRDSAEGDGAAPV